MLLGGLTDILWGGLHDPTAKARKAGCGLGKRRRAVHRAGQGAGPGAGAREARAHLPKDGLRAEGRHAWASLVGVWKEWKSQ